MVRRAAAALGALEHQLELLAHPLLADELVQPARAQRRLDDAAPRRRRRAGPALASAVAAGQLVGLAPGQLVVAHRAAPERGERLAQQRRHVGVGGVGVGLGQPDDDLVGLRGGPAEPDQRLRQGVAPARRARSAGGAGARPRRPCP